MPSMYDIIANSDDCPVDIKQKYFSITKDTNAINYNISRLKFLKAKVERLMLIGTPDQISRAIKAAEAHIQLIIKLNAQIEQKQEGIQLTALRETVDAMEKALGKDAYGK